MIEVLRQQVNRRASLRLVWIRITFNKAMLEHNVVRLRQMSAVITRVDVSDACAGIGKLNGRARRAKLRVIIPKMPTKRWRHAKRSRYFVMIRILRNMGGGSRRQGPTNWSRTAIIE